MHGIVFGPPINMADVLGGEREEKHGMVNGKNFCNYSLIILQMFTVKMKCKSLTAERATGWLIHCKVSVKTIISHDV